MDPQKRFLASTLQGAMDAEVVTLEDLFKHIPAKKLAEHIPSDILWTVLTEGMQRAGLGPGPGMGASESASGGMSSPAPAQEKKEFTPSAPSRDIWSSGTQSLLDKKEPAESKEISEGDVASLLDDATNVEDGVELNFDVTDDLGDIEEMPPIPESDADNLIVEEVAWDDDDK